MQVNKQVNSVLTFILHICLKNKIIGHDNKFNMGIKIS